MRPMKRLGVVPHEAWAGGCSVSLWTQSMRLRLSARSYICYSNRGGLALPPLWLKTPPAPSKTSLELAMKHLLMHLACKEWASPKKLARRNASCRGEGALSTFVSTHGHWLALLCRGKPSQMG